MERPRPSEKRKEQPQNRFPLERERLREGERQRERARGGDFWNNAPSAAGAMATGVRVYECVCVGRTFFFVLIELICCLFSAASLTHS